MRKARWSTAGRPRISARLLLTAALLLATLSSLIPLPGFTLNQTSAASRMIKMPFASGADWTITQGYNTDPNTGGSHYNCLEYPGRSCSPYWTYKYSFDLVRADGNTAGQTVLSPVNGTIRWIDEAYGGMSIDLGNGWAVAYFHTTLAPGLTAGQAVVQGQVMGAIAPPGQGGNGGFPHMHITLWQTSDGGNWDRNAKPFTGTQSLDGYDFPNQSGTPRNQYRGTTVRSSNTQIGDAPTVPRQVAKLSPAHGTSLSQSRVTLSWAPTAGATSYQVLVDDGGQTSPWVSGTTWTTNTLNAGTHTWKVRARNAAGTGTWSSTWRFYITTGASSSELDDGAMISTGVYSIIGTRQGMVGGRTSSGHVIVENDHFVSLPACTNVTCDWLTPGTTHSTYGYVTDCGNECYVMIYNPAKDKCTVAPVLDRGPWFNVDNFWDVPSKRFVNMKIAEKGLNYSLAQGYSAAPAARDGYDVGWGKTGDIGNSNQTSNGVNYPVGLPVSIDIGDGSWLDLGFPWDPGPQAVVVTMLWQVSETVAGAKDKCSGTTGEQPKPYFTTSKSGGVAGAVMTINGKNFGPNETVKIYLDSSKTTPIGTATTGGDGRFSSTFTVPDTVGGLHRVHAVGQTSKLRVGKDFRILPRSSISKSSGSANMTITLTGY
ncbi:MAG: M23 family metallopeptidase, partial [Chloroflexota bacterium]|nr:M23 family metallopeptidase [Chloroflexota bacterium]